jgi:hypothetical protein
MRISAKGRSQRPAIEAFGGFDAERLRERGRKIDRADKAFVASEQSSSSSGRPKTRGSMTWNKEVRVGRTSVSLKGSVAIAVASEVGTRSARWKLYAAIRAWCIVWHSAI